MAVARGKIRCRFREPFLSTYRPRIDLIREFCGYEFIKIYRLPKDAVIELATGLKDRGFRGPLHDGRQKRTVSAVLVIGQNMSHFPKVS